MTKRKFKNDIILIAALLIFALLIFIIYKTNLKEGNIVKVSIDGETVLSYNLKDTVKTNIFPNGKNILVIKNGEAYIEDADCPDKICVSHRKISKIGQNITCLPHKLVVSITEEE